MRRAISLALAAILAVGVLVAVVLSLHKTSPSISRPAALTEVRGVIGSEKLPFFQDAGVQAAFANHGFKVTVDTAGSRTIATTTDLSKYDFAFPAGTPSAEKIRQDRKISKEYVPFFTPMVVATFKPIADLFVKDGIATASAPYYTLDVQKYLDLVAKNTRWTDLPNNTAYPAGKAILITSTDVTKSNSAAMYLALASYVANANNVVQSTSQADAVLPAAAPLFLRQGFTESSSEEPFNDYLSIGIGKTPMVMIYEAQFRASEAAKDGSITSDMTLMYPSVEVFSKHTLVPLTSRGDAIGQLLTTDPDLQHLAVKFGFRTQDVAYDQSFAAKNAILPSPPLVDVIETPTFDELEYLINAIQRRGA